MSFITLTAKVTTRRKAVEDEVRMLLAEALRLGGQEVMLQVAEVAGEQHYSLDELRRMGHPYSRRMGGMGLNPGIINRQSGAFFQGFKLQGPEITENSVSLRLINTDDKEDLLRLGTEYMIPRPYQREINKALGKKLMEQVLRAMNPKYNVKITG